jgi:hypothetical protein
MILYSKRCTYFLFYFRRAQHPTEYCRSSIRPLLLLLRGEKDCA